MRELASVQYPLKLSDWLGDSVGCRAVVLWIHSGAFRHLGDCHSLSVARSRVVFYQCRAASTGGDDQAQDGQSNNVRYAHVFSLSQRLSIAESSRLVSLMVGAAIA